VLMKDRFDYVLRKLGGPIPANATPLQTWATYVTTCKPPADCKALNQSINGFSAGGVKLDANGKGNFPAVPPGVYYVMGMVAFENQPVYWDLRAELKPGANTLVLSVQNAER
jgi:hypothetical protein